MQEKVNQQSNLLARKTLCEPTGSDFAININIPKVLVEESTKKTYNMHMTCIAATWLIYSALTMFVVNKSKYCLTTNASIGQNLTKVFS